MRKTKLRVGWGSGFVGSTTAQRIVDMDLADVVITDILGWGSGGARGAGHDGVRAGLRGPIQKATGDFSTASGDLFRGDGEQAIVVVITAGFPRKPGMSRDESAEGPLPMW